MMMITDGWIVRFASSVPEERERERELKLRRHMRPVHDIALVGRLAPTLANVRHWLMELLD